MNILVVGSVKEYSSGEERLITKVIEDELKKLGHTTDSFLLPYKPDPLIVLDQFMAYQGIDVSAADMLICVGYPAFTLRHRNKIAYLLEDAPMFHEYWDSEYGVIADYTYSQIYFAINEITKKNLQECKKIFCDSKLLVDDVQNRYSLNAEYLLYPIRKVTTDGKEEKKDYYVMETCLLQNERYLEIIGEFVTTVSATLKVYVPSASKMHLESLKRVIIDKKWDKKVELLMGNIPETILINSKGYINTAYQTRRVDNALLRSIQEKVLVVSLEDGGAVNELLINQRNAFITSIEKLSIALNKGLKFTVQGKKSVDSITSEEFVKRLVEQ